MKYIALCLLPCLIITALSLHNKVSIIGHITVCSTIIIAIIWHIFDLLCDKIDKIDKNKK